MIRRNKKEEIVSKAPNQTHNNLITGMFIGFIMYIAFDMYRDEKRRKQLFNDLQEFKKELQPYVESLRDYLENSSEFKQAIIAVDESLGTQLYKFIATSGKKVDTSSSKDKPSRRSTTSIGRFFKIKK